MGGTRGWMSLGPAPRGGMGQEEEARLLQAALLRPQPSFNQIQPAPVKPIQFTPAKFDFPSFFSEPFTFQATFNTQPGPGSYVANVGR